MRRFLRGLLYAVPAYFLAAVAGALAVNALSSNQHDRPLEAAMTGAFVIGPLAALLAFIAGLLRTRRRAPDATTSSRNP